MITPLRQEATHCRGLMKRACALVVVFLFMLAGVPAQAFSSQESTGTWNASRTVSGTVMTTTHAGSLPWILEPEDGEVPVAGVRVYAYWVEQDGSVSPTYHTTSGADGRYSINMASFTEVTGTVHTFDATFGERLKVWVDPNTAPAGLELTYAESRGTVATNLERDYAMWLPISNKVTNFNFAFRQADDLSLHGTPVASTRYRDGFMNPANKLYGKVFWDMANTWGGGEIIPFKGPADTGAAGVKVTATVKDPTTNTSVTVYGYTDNKGNYELYIPEPFDPDTIPGHQSYVTIEPPGGMTYFTKMSDPRFYNSYLDIGQGTVVGWDSLHNVDFALLPHMTATYRILQYNNTDQLATNGDTVVAGATGLIPGGTKYRVVWYDANLNVVKECRSITADNSGATQDCPFTVPADLQENMVYSAQIYDSSGKLIGSDSFSATPLWVTSTFPDGATGAAYAAPPATVVGSAGGYTFSATGLPPGVTIDPATGALTGTPTVPGDYNVVLTVTDSTGKQATYTDTITIASGPLNLANVTNPGVLGEPYSHVAPSTTGGTGPYTYSATGLPAGLSIDPASGQISGTPTDDGTSSVTVTVTDATGATKSITTDLVVTVPQLVLTADTTLPGGDTGVAYTGTTPSAAGGKPNYTYSSQTGTNAGGLPAGLSVDPTTGKVTGTPTEWGTFTHLLTVTDAAGNTAQVAQTITVVPPPLTMSSPTFPVAATGTAYTGPAPTVTGGTGGYQFTATNLPDGLSIDPATGVISGTPTTSGAKAVTVTVTDSSGESVSFTSTLDVDTNSNTTPLVIDHPLMPHATIGESYTGVTPTTTGGDGNYTYSSTDLPAGMNIDPTTGVITGTPTTVGTYPVHVTVTDGGGQAVSYADTIVVKPQPLVINAALPDGTALETYPTTTVTASGGQGSYTYSAVGLPAGLSIDATTGKITGTPTQPGTYSVAVTVTDAAGATAVSNHNVTIGVAPLDMTATLPQIAIIGEPYTSNPPTVSGGIPPYSFTAVGLPDGLSIDPSTGVVSGTPTTPGDSTVTIILTVNDGTGQSTAVSQVISVEAPPMTISMPDLPATQNGQPFSAVAPTVSGGIPGYTFSATGLPAGVTIDPATGALSGAPTESGDFNVVITATDSDNHSISITKPLSVTNAPLTAGIVLPPTEVGAPYPSVRPNVAGGDGNYTYSVTGLPAGLSVDPNTGEFSGSATESGTFTAIIEISDGSGASITLEPLLFVQPEVLSLKADAPPSGEENVPYAGVQPTVSGGSGPYTFAATGLPDGLTIDPATGKITGIPATGTTGEHPITITVTDSKGATASIAGPINIGQTGSTPVLYLESVHFENATVGSPTSTIAPRTTGGTGGNVYSASGLPDGLSIDPTTGIISGTPTTPGDYLITVSVSDSRGTTASFSDVMTVVPVPLNVNMVDFNATVGEQISGPELTTSGGTAPYTYSAQNLPPGMTIDTSTGVISGTPTTPGTYVTNISVTDYVIDTAINTVTITVTAAPIVTNISYVQVPADVPYVSPVPTSTGGVGPYTYSATNLPPGLTMDSTGKITGTPTAPGTYNVTITTTDSRGESITQTVPLMINSAPLDVASAEFPAGTEGTAYTGPTPTTVGGTGIYQYSATGMPDGLTIDPDTGVISGSPPAGEHYVTVLVTDTNGNTASFTEKLVIGASPPLPILDIVETIYAPAPVDQPFEQVINPATGGVGPYTYSATGMPDGLTMDPATGTFSGTPTTPGDYDITIIVTDAQGSTASFTDVLNVEPAPLTISGTLDNATVGNSYASAVPDTAGGIGPYTYSTTELPAGLSINPVSGQIKGIPTTHGSTSVTVTATDSRGITTSFTHDLVVYPGQLVVKANLPDGQEGQEYTPFTPTVSGGVGPYQHIVTGLPDGLSVDSRTGQVTGTPTESGVFTVTWSTTDSQGTSVSKTRSLVITAKPLVIVAQEYSPMAAGTSFTSDPQITVGGTGPFQYSATNLPPGITINPTTGVLSGTPTQQGDYLVTVNVVDAQGATASFTDVMSISTGTVKDTLGIDGVDYPNITQVDVVDWFSPTPLGGVGPYTFSATGLPDGLTIDPNTGKISGQATTKGTYEITVTVTDSLNATASFTDEMTVAASPITVDLTLPPVTVDTNYMGDAPEVSGNVGSVTYVAQGLPEGLAMNPYTGAVVGTPTTVGTYTVAITVSDITGNTTTVTKELVVAPTPMVATWEDLAEATAGEPYTAPAPTVTGGYGGHRFTADLPTGLMIDPDTGVISGTPTSPGTHDIVITITDAQDVTTTVTKTLAINAAPLQFTTGTNLPNGTVGTGYTSTAPTLTGGSGSYTFSAVGLPQGLVIDPATGIISGAPVVPGDYSVTITATDASGVTRSFTDAITVAAATGDEQLGLPDGSVGSSYTSTPPELSTTGPHTFTAQGLPAGLSINPDTGVISGVPSAPGTYTVTVTATNSAGAVTEFTEVVVVQQPTNPDPVLLSPTLEFPNATIGLPYTAVLPTATGGNGTYSYTVNGLPPGLKFVPTTRAVSGKPTKLGTFMVTVTAADGTGESSSRVVELVVAAQPATTPDGTPGAGDQEAPAPLTPKGPLAWTGPSSVVWSLSIGASLVIVGLAVRRRGRAEQQR